MCTRKIERNPFPSLPREKWTDRQTAILAVFYGNFSISSCILLLQVFIVNVQQTLLKIDRSSFFFLF